MRAFAPLLLLLTVHGFAQNSRRTQIAAIAKDADGTVSVSCELPDTKLNCDLNAHNHAPMQPMYKLPLALTALHLAEMGKLLPDQRPWESTDVILERKVRFLPTDIIPDSYSPLTDRYPKANVDVMLRWEGGPFLSPGRIAGRVGFSALVHATPGVTASRFAGRIANRTTPITRAMITSAKFRWMP